MIIFMHVNLTISSNSPLSDRSSRGLGRAATVPQAPTRPRQESTPLAATAWQAPTMHFQA